MLRKTLIAAVAAAAIALVPTAGSARGGSGGSAGAAFMVAVSTVASPEVVGGAAVGVEAGTGVVGAVRLSERWASASV